jgi:hypothetical protein
MKMLRIRKRRIAPKYSRLRPRGDDGVTQDVSVLFWNMRRIVARDGHWS